MNGNMSERIIFFSNVNSLEGTYVVSFLNKGKTRNIFVHVNVDTIVETQDNTNIPRSGDVRHARRK